MTTERPFPLDSLLAQSDWITALSRALVADPATADDVAQAAWVDVLQQRPRSILDPRSWLATIVRRKAQRTHRSGTRRAKHERGAAAVRAAETAPSAADLAIRVAMHRELADAVLALDEPYRETIVLRFFENLGVAAIAGRMQTKHNTVRSRLQRGLQTLRERFDRDHGGREHWLPAVIALADRHTVHEGSGAGPVIPAGLATAFAAQKAALAVVAVVVAAVLAIPLVAPTATSVAPGPDPGAPSAAASSTTPVVDASDTRRPSPGASLPVGNSRAPAATTSSPDSGVAAAAPVRRRLVDRDGKALEGVRMRAAATTTVRWQGGDRGWISGAGRTLRILADEEERLRTDPRYADEFFAKLPYAEEWRATVLDEAMPLRDARTDREGTFLFPPPLPVDDRTIDVADARFVLVTAGSADASPWVAGPAVRVEGTVHDADGAPIADAMAIAMCPTAQEPIELHAQSATRTDEQGAFLVRRALANGLIRVSCDGYETAEVPLSQNPVQRPYVVLHRPGFTVRRTITGIVTTSGGAPVGKASVWFGRQHTTTAADGRFTLAADAAKPQYALTIVAKGWAALQLPDFGKQVLSGGALQDLTFVLEKKPRSVRGFVVGPDGTAVEGALVFLVDPTLLDVTFDTVESRVAEAPAIVRTDATGAFVLDGLDDRAYRVRAVDPRTGASETSRASKPGTRVLELQLPKAGPRFPGRLVDADGLPLRDATVEIAFFTHVTKGGGTQMESTPAIACSDAGVFEMSVGPDTNAWLCVRVHGQIRQMTPVMELLARRPITCDGSRWLTLLFGAGSRGRPAHFQMADGTLNPERIDTRSDRPVAIPKGAVAVILDKETPEMTRLELTDDLAVHLRAP